MPLFSVITPIYNSQQWLDQCIQSLLTQTEQNFELILVDDGSTDRSLSISRNYSNENQRINIIESKHLGVSHARNLALEHASGKYVLFVDSDDWLDSFALEKLGSLCLHANLDFIIFNYVLVQKSGNEHHSKNMFPANTVINRQEFNDVYFRKLVSYNYHPYLCDKVYCLSLIKSNNLQFEENISYGEDWLFVVNYCRHVKRAYYYDEKLYFYRRTNINSLSQRFIPENFKKNILWEYNTKKKLVNEFNLIFEELSYELFIHRIIACILYEFKNEKNIFKLYKNEKEYCNSNITIEILKNLGPAQHRKIIKEVLIELIKKKRIFLLSACSIVVTFFRYLERRSGW